jgi:hypothetical protein
MSLSVLVYALYVLLCCASTLCLAGPGGLNGGERRGFASHHFIHSGQNKPMARQHLAKSGAQGMENRDGAGSAIHQPRPVVREKGSPQHNAHRGRPRRPLARFARQLQPLIGRCLLVEDLQSKPIMKQTNEQTNTYLQTHTTNTYNHTYNKQKRTTTTNKQQYIYIYIYIYRYPIQPHTYNHTTLLPNIQLQDTTTAHDVG